MIKTYFEDWGDPGITPRDQLAKLVQAASYAGAAVIALDIILLYSGHPPRN